MWLSEDFFNKSYHTYPHLQQVAPSNRLRKKMQFSHLPPSYAESSQMVKVNILNFATWLGPAQESGKWGNSFPLCPNPAGLSPFALILLFLFDRQPFGPPPSCVMILFSLMNYLSQLRPAWQHYHHCKLGSFLQLSLIWKMKNRFPHSAISPFYRPIRHEIASERSKPLSICRHMYAHPPPPHMSLIRISWFAPRMVRSFPH